MERQFKQSDIQRAHDRECRRHAQVVEALRELLTEAQGRNLLALSRAMQKARAALLLTDTEEDRDSDRYEDARNDARAERELESEDEP